MKFPKRIADYVRLEWSRYMGTVAVVHTDLAYPLLDLTELPYKNGRNIEEAKRYVGRQLCDFLKNQTTSEQIVHDYWMNQYLEREEIRKAIRTVTANVADVK